MDSTENMDMLYIMSTKGNRDCLNKLFDKYLALGKTVLNGTIASFGASRCIVPSEFFGLICELFLTIMKNYNPRSSSFEVYARSVLNKRITRAVSETLNQKTGNILSLDDNDEEERPVIESIEDKTLVSIPDQISSLGIEEMLYYKNTKGNKDKAATNKIITMLLQGYTRYEIAEKLNISIGRVRYLLKVAEKQVKLSKIKMELK